MAQQIRVCSLPQRDHAAEEQLAALTSRTGDVCGHTAHPDAEHDRGHADPRLLLIFLEEATEMLPRLQAALSDWRREPGATEPARAMTRLLHTLKGSARVAGALRLGERIHLLEGHVGRALGAAASELEELQAEVDAIEAHIDRLGADHDRRAASPAAAAPALTTEERAKSVQARATSGRILVDRELLEQLGEHANEMGLSGARVERDVAALRQSLDDLADSIGRLRGQLRETQMQADSQLPATSIEPGRSEAGFDPLEMDRYTRMQELTRMMAESLHDMQMVQTTLAASAADVEAAAALQARLGRGMQQDLSALNSMPFGTLRGRLQRTVRQCARELERQVELRLEGADMALDRSLLQQLTAPLEHLVRNAVAHGIEPAAIRSARGKPAAGEIVVAAKREGIDAVLTVRDDGAGIDVARLRDEAVRRGLAAAEEDIGDAKLKAFIFTPGLSTATQVTATSGRGIGLDAVRSQIEALGGAIELATSPDEGTVFDIRLPLYSAASQVLLVQADEAVYAVPSALVAGIEELSAPELALAHAEGVLVHAALSFPLWSLARLLGNGRAPEAKRQVPVLLLESDGQRMALQVDAVLRSQEVLLKPLGPQLARVRGLAGGAMLGTDEVALVLNPLAWPDAPKQQRAEIATGSAVSESAPDRVLVVDDSLTVRRLTVRLLARSGYRVREAKDGADALQQMQQYVPDLIILDLEMPRMDGFELMRELRSSALTASVPIVVVSSRLADKHRRRAFESGAAAFFGKPYPEDALLACVEQLLRLGSTARAA
jgi:chemosensory pili system protein ChpA (sensor histidine kinase/response regulator)